MKYTYKDEDFWYGFDFKINGDFVVPDDGTYEYKIRNTSGEVLYSGTYSPEISGDDEEETEKVTSPDSGSFVVPAEYNTLGEGNLFDTRIVEIRFSVNDKPQIIKDSYRITDFYYFSATPKDVRDYYGLNSGELPDEDIDLVEIYLQLVQKHGDTFINALKTAGVANIRANRLIVLKSVVQNFSSVRLRVNQEENDGSSKFIRYLNKIDWDALLARAEAELEDLENNLTGEENISYTDYVPFMLGAVTDAITGEES